jgi:hypothetical protein
MQLKYPETQIREDQERQELKAILDSGILKKAPNLQHFLEYVAEEHFTGNSDQLKEYNIAVHALHRPEQFDPQSDTIVRVAAHALRKKLEQYYATEGAGHPLQIQLPAGKYALSFVRKTSDPEPASSTAVSPPVQGSDRRWLFWAGAGVLLAILLVPAGEYLTRQKPSVMVTKVASSSSSAVTERGDVIHIRFGPDNGPYTDAAGQRWTMDSDCQGGTTFVHPAVEIQGTDDAALFLAGREGKFQCKIPVPPGAYQLELLFADTSGDKEAARYVDFNVNDRRTDAIDVVDEAGGNNIAVGKVYAGIRPMSDGNIHLDFTSDGAFINALELTPSESDSGAPLRMLAGPAVLRDDSGNIWRPERFFAGGRRTSDAENLPKDANARLFEWERFGHFHYLIPVVPGKEYRVKLYFSEGWFGAGNGGFGGIGSRAFDVYCNGTTLLNDFDILKQQAGRTVVITSDHVKPTAHGMLELNFAPVKNYALINAIEVEPEG